MKMKIKLIIIGLLLFGSCTKSSDLDPTHKKNDQEQEEVQDGVKLGYSLAKGKWHQVTDADLTGLIYFAKNDLYNYSIEGTLQRRSFLRRFDQSTQAWVPVYEQLNPQAEQVGTDPNGNIYMAVTHLRTEGWGVGTTKSFYTYKIQRLTANDEWESLGEIPNPTQANFTTIYLFHIGGKLHFFGTRNSTLSIYSLNSGSWSITASIDNITRSGTVHHHNKMDGTLLFTVAKMDSPETYLTYTFDGNQLKKMREDNITTNLTLAEDGLYHHSSTDAVLYRSHGQKMLFNLPAVTIQNHKYERRVNWLAASSTKVYAQVQRYVIPEWLNEALAVYEISTGKIIWIPNTPDYNSKAVINDVVNRGKKHYFLLQKQVLNVSQKHLYYFEEE